MKKAYAAVPLLALLFFGKTAPAADLTMIIPTGNSGLHFANAKVFGMHLKEKLGAAALVIQTMPGAGGVKAANYLANVAPKDGSYIGSVLPNTVQDAILFPKKVKFDPQTFLWLGGLDETNAGIMVAGRTGITTLEDARRKTAVLGASSKRSGTYIIPQLANEFLDTKFKIVTGYRSSIPEFNLAMQRGEIDGVAASLEQLKSIHPEWVKSGYVRVLAVAALSREKDLPGVPLLSELSGSMEDRELFEFISSSGIFGRVWFAPPGTPQEKVAVLRASFEQVLEDPAFLADAAKSKLSISPVSWQLLERVTRQMAHASPRTLDRLRETLQ